MFALPHPAIFWQWTLLFPIFSYDKNANTHTRPCSVLCAIYTVVFVCVCVCVCACVCVCVFDFTRWWTPLSHTIINTWYCCQIKFFKLMSIQSVWNKLLFSRLAFPGTAEVEHHSLMLVFLSCFFPFLLNCLFILLAHFSFLLNYLPLPIGI